MAAPTTTPDLFDIIRKSQLLTDAQLDAVLSSHPELDTPALVVRTLQADGLLTKFQAEQLLRGRHRGFVLGKYRLLDRIGMGGMGQVYLAEHTSMKRRVALKVLPPDRSGNAFARERFLRESRAAALLEHPNLVRAFDVEMDGDVAYLVMEYIDGVTLHDLIARRGRITPQRAANYIWQVASGLTAVHDRSLIHRDIKPANLLLDRTGVVRILDLGLVRSELDDDALTRGEGAKIVGTADYLAPEQAVNSSTVDARADLYSLGCTAYYLLAGQAPFHGGKISQKLISHAMKDATPLHIVNNEVPMELAAVVQKLMAKKIEDRYRSAREAMDALSPWARLGASVPLSEDFPESNGGINSPGTGVSFNSWSGNGPVSGGSRLFHSIQPSGSAVQLGTQSGASQSPSGANQPTVANALQETLPGRAALPPTPEPNPVFAMPPLEPSWSDTELLDAATEKKMAAMFGVNQPKAKAKTSGLFPAILAMGVLAIIAIGSYFLVASIDAGAAATKPTPTRK